MSALNPLGGPMFERELTSEQHTLALRFSHVALPVHVIDCQPWEWHGDTWRRLFTVQEWQVADVVVSVWGEQSNRGELTYEVYVDDEEQSVDADRNALREALTEAKELLSALAHSLTDRSYSESSDR